MVVIVFGLPGSGKSYFASRLAAQMGAQYISSDQLRRQMFSERTYSHAEKTAVYEAMLRLASGRAKLGYSVVLDATFHQAFWRQQYADTLQPYTTHFIEVLADEALIVERLKKPRAFSEADEVVYHTIKAEWEPMAEDHLILRSSDTNSTEMLHLAMRYLNTSHETPLQ